MRAAHARRRTFIMVSFATLMMKSPICSILRHPQHVLQLYKARVILRPQRNVQPLLFLSNLRFSTEASLSRKHQDQNGAA